VQQIISETGTDMSKFPTVKHFTSWLTLAPHNDISGGKVLSSKTQKSKNRAAQAFRMAAQSVSRSNSAQGAFYRRMRVKHGGGAKATTATAHKIARIFYFMLKHQQEYKDPGQAYYEQKYQERTVKNLKRKAKALGMELIPIQGVSR
ncbi:MAG: transposase, partial [Chloroflexi bacterium]|nr:transposase [Chloroflexota bacterium]MBU1660728.1 transposase [Chloroflexota bacterium]